MRPVHAVMFDMDGTLVQTRHASWEIFHTVSDRFSLGIDTPEQYYELFRTNIFARLDTLCAGPDQARQVKEAFLEGLRAGYHPVMIPGMVHVVRRLASVTTLALLSSNAMPVMRRILVENDLAFCFAQVFGGDIVPDKRTAIRQFLEDAGSGFGRRCSADYDEQMLPAEVAAEGTVLVTDTAGDVREAVEEGIRAVGVAWGMHGVDQLAEAGAEFVALWPQEVSSYLLQGISALPRGACAVGGSCPSSDSGLAASGCDGCPGACPSSCGIASAPAPTSASVRAERRRRAATALVTRTSTSVPPDRDPDRQGEVRASAELRDAVRRISPAR